MKAKSVVVSGLVSGLVIFAVGIIVNLAVQAVSPYDVLKLGGMRSPEDPVTMLFFLYPWVTGFALAIVYSYVGKSLEGTATQKGLRFGLLMWLVSSLPSAYVVYTSMNYPAAFSVSSIVSSLVYMPLAGMAIARMTKK